MKCTGPRCALATAVGIRAIHTHAGRTFLSCCAISDPASPIFSLSSAAASQRTKPSTRRRASSSCSTPDRMVYIHRPALAVLERPPLHPGYPCAAKLQRAEGQEGRASPLHMCNERPHGVRAPFSSSRVRCEAARVASSSPFPRPAGRLHARRCYRRESCPTVGGRPGPLARELPGG